MPGQAASKDELSRLHALGLKEVPVFGTSYALLAQENPDAEPASIEQRKEMAARLVEVGPLLPKYVQHAINTERPVVSVAKILTAAVPNTTRKDATMKPGKPVVEKMPSTAELEKMFKKNAKENAQAAAEKKKADAAAAKKKEKEDEARRKARKNLKAADVTPKVATPKPGDKREAAKKGAAAVKAKAGAGGGIGGLVKRLLKDGKSTEDILKAVKKDYPKAKTSPASVAWYRSQMRQDGELPKA